MPIGIVYARKYFVFPLIQRRETAVRIWTVILFSLICISAAMSEAPTVSMGYCVLAIVGFTSAGGLWYCLKDRMQDCLALYAILGTLIVGYVYLTVPLHKGRLSWSASTPPNHLALVCFGVLAASLAIRLPWLSYFCLAIQLLVIVATQGRGNLVGALLTLGTFVVLTQMSRKNNALTILKAAGLMGVIAAVLLAYHNHVQEAIAVSSCYMTDTAGSAPGSLGDLMRGERPTSYS